MFSARTQVWNESMKQKILGYIWLLQMARTKQTMRGVVHGDGKPRAMYPHKKPIERKTSGSKEKERCHKRTRYPTCSEDSQRERSTTKVGHECYTTGFL